MSQFLLYLLKTTKHSYSNLKQDLKELLNGINVAQK